MLRKEGAAALLLSSLAITMSTSRMYPACEGRIEQTAQRARRVTGPGLVDSYAEARRIGFAACTLGPSEVAIAVVFGQERRIVIGVGEGNTAKDRAADEGASHVTISFGVSGNRRAVDGTVGGRVPSPEQLALAIVLGHKQVKESGGKQDIRAERTLHHNTR